MSQAEYEFVQRYKALASDAKNHEEIMKDVTFLQLLACLLDRSDVRLVKMTLQTLQLLAQNEANHNTMKSTFGVLETITLISGRYLGVADDLVELSNDIIGTINASPTKISDSPVKYHTEIHEKKAKTEVINLLVHGLCEEKQTDMEMALVSIKGVVSFTIDVIHQRCTVRYMNHITPKLIVENVAAKAHLEAKLIVRNKLNQEVLMSVSNNDDDTKSNLLPYLSEEHSPVKDKAVSMFGEFQSNASGIFKWFQESFYW